MTDPIHLKYTPTHEWVSTDGAALRIGITDYAQHRLSDVTSVELPEPDDHHYQADEEIGIIESLRTSIDFHAPVAGTIVGINTALLSHPERINEDPYGAGWLIEMKPDSKSDVTDLLDLCHYDAMLPDYEEE